MVTETLDKLEQILGKHAGEEGALIQVLLDVQAEYNWLPEDILSQVSARLDVPLSYIYRVASFYKAMNLTQRGRYLIRICSGTACHVHGGPKIWDRAQEILAIGEGDTTPDMQFTLERVNCLGCCAIGPVLMVDENYYGKVSSAKVADILGNYK